MKRGFRGGLLEKKLEVKIITITRNKMSKYILLPLVVFIAVMAQLDLDGGFAGVGAIVDLVKDW